MNSYPELEGQTTELNTRDTYKLLDTLICSINEINPVDSMHFSLITAIIARIAGPRAATRARMEAKYEGGVVYFVNNEETALDILRARILDAPVS